MARLTSADAQLLEPYLRAGMKGLHRSRWKLGAPLEYLVAPIVLQVIVQVARDICPAELAAGDG